MNDHFNGLHFFWDQESFPHGLFKVLKWRLQHYPAWPRHVIPDAKVAKLKERVHDGVEVTYIGHATLLIQGMGLNILTDPIFSVRAGPAHIIGVRRVQLPFPRLSQLPPIDFVFISHNHYDHLDLRTLRKIWKRWRPSFIAPLGVDRDLYKINGSIPVCTLDWDQSLAIAPGISLQLLPAKHWSARSIRDRNRSLWASALFTFEETRLLFVADTGFDEALFRRIKGSIGPGVDLAILPIGAYDPRWFMAPFHMTPEEAFEAFLILQAKKMLPIHYDIFPLSDEPFGEALPRLLSAAGDERDRVVALKVGEQVGISSQTVV